MLLSHKFTLFFYYSQSYKEVITKHKFICLFKQNNVFWVPLKNHIPFFSYCMLLGDWHFFFGGAFVTQLFPLN